MKKKSVGINAVLNVIKQCCAILFPIITFPYISRVLQTENYGKVNFGNSIITYVTLFAALGLTNYAIREGARIRNDKKAFQTFANQVFTINCNSQYKCNFGTNIISKKNTRYAVNVVTVDSEY